jgi:hypothetical protein
MFFTQAKRGKDTLKSVKKPRNNNNDDDANSTTTTTTTTMIHESMARLILSRKVGELSLPPPDGIQISTNSVQHSAHVLTSLSALSRSADFSHLISRFRIPSTDD